MSPDTRGSAASSVCRILLGLMWLLLAGCERSSDALVPAPPSAERIPHAVLGPTGARSDPYHWLRDDRRRDPKVRAHLEAENRYTEAMLAPLAGLRGELVREMRGRLPELAGGAGWREHGDWYGLRQRLDEQHPVHIRRRGGPDGPEQVLIDANALTDGSPGFRIAGQDLSPDGRQLAWLEQRGTGRSFRLRLRDLETGRISDPGIDGIASLSWSVDGRSLYLVEHEAGTLRPYRVRRYRPDAPIEDAPVIHEEHDPAFVVRVGRTRSGRYDYLFARSADASELRWMDPNRPQAGPRVLLPRTPGHLYSADHAAGAWVIKTNLEAPNFRIVEAPESAPADRSGWVERVPHRVDALIHEFDLFDRHLALVERVDGLRRLRVVDRATGSAREFGFGDAPHVLQLGRNPDPTSATVQFVRTSPTVPRETWTLDLASGALARIHRIPPPPDFDAKDYRALRLQVEARDGARIPVSLVARRDTPLDGRAPLYLHGYGAYGRVLEPDFSTERLSLLDRGFVYAIAHVRGGQAGGRAWYDQGRAADKMNSFTDFIDVAASLVDRGMVDPDRVYAVGASAGGLLVAAAANLAPERFDAVVAHVPFVDVVTSMLDPGIPLTALEYREWGDPRIVEDYARMLAYSPYDNVGRHAYPAMLITAGFWDAQVPYWEAAKWAARVRERRTDDGPVLLRVDLEAGHGGRPGRLQRLDDTAIEFAFLLQRAGCVERTTCAGSG